MEVRIPFKRGAVAWQSLTPLGSSVVKWIRGVAGTGVVGGIVGVVDVAHGEAILCGEVVDLPGQATTVDGTALYQITVPLVS